MPQNVDERYAQLLQPSQELINDIASLKGDIIVLGAGGKMGPALCTLAMSAINIAGASKKVVAISRFREEGVQQGLQAQGIHTINADLLNDNDLQSLPNAENVVYMAGMKFGSTANASLTWAMNTYLPGRVAEKYRSSNIVAFSTGNVYPLMDIKSGGATEEVAPEPVGEYAQSCLGRERMFQYFSTLNNTPVCIYRLNYANDVTYGVLLEIAKSVKEEKPIDLSMGYFNAIWQGDANEIALRALRVDGSSATTSGKRSPIFRMCRPSKWPPSTGIKRSMWYAPFSNRHAMKRSHYTPAMMIILSLTF